MVSSFVFLKLWSAETTRCNSQILSCLRPITRYSEDGSYAQSSLTTIAPVHATEMGIRGRIIASLPSGSGVSSGRILKKITTRRLLEDSGVAVANVPM